MSLKGIVLAGGAGTRLHPAQQMQKLAQRAGNGSYSAYLASLLPGR
jgi:dTDP-glucose pyrophosphorylase